MAWGEGKQEVLLKYYTMLLTVLDEVAESSNNSNIETNFFSGKCGGQQKKNEFLLAAYLRAVTHFKIYSVAHKYIAVFHTHNYGVSSYCLVEKNITKPLKSALVSLRQSMLQLLEQRGRTERHSKFRAVPRHDFGCQGSY